MESTQKEGENNVPEMKIRFENQKSSKKLFKITLPTDMLIQNGMDSICPVAFCRKKIPKNRSIEEHLREHLVQVFRKVVTDCEINSQPQFDVRYHCSIKDCRYSDVTDKGKCFDNVKYLKQHYVKVHASKDFKCLKCQKAFPLLSYVESHQARCGMVFACSCGQTYSTLEALQTHLRRRKHSVDLTQYKKILSVEKSRIQEMKTTELISKASTKSTTTTNAKVSLSSKKKFQMILPDLSSTVTVYSSQPAAEQRQFEMINSYDELPKKFVDFETQTAPQQQRLNSGKNNKLLGPKRKKSAETQTARVRVKVNTETQTTNVVKRRRSTRKKQSAEAQTQCHNEVGSQSSQQEDVEDNNNTSKTDPTLQIDIVRESNPETLCSNEDSNIANPILGFDISDSFFKEMEVHNQTQTDPDDKFLFDGDNILSDYDVANLTQTDTDDFLNFVTTETQTANPSTVYNNFMDSATDPFPDVTAATCSGSIAMPSDDHLLSFNSSYLETIDNETQTQFDFWANLLD